MKLLLLAGTTEARQLADALAARPDTSVLASLAGATRAPQALAVPTRIGGFQGEAGFRTALVDGGFDAVIDATHPFAQRISERSARVCAELGVLHLRIDRPGWSPGPGDRWTFIDDEAQAAHVIPQGARVLVATGRQTLDRLSNMHGRWLVVRQIDPPEAPFPFDHGEYLVGRAPFRVEEEVALFQRLRLDWVLVKNSGGDASRPKLDAARQLGMQVAMVRRPDPPAGPRVESVADALQWLDRLP